MDKHMRQAAEAELRKYEAKYEEAQRALVEKALQVRFAPYFVKKH